MKDPNSPLVLVETRHGTHFAGVEAQGLDVDFPPEVRGWSDVLDCRDEPYTDESTWPMERLCEFAQHVRKRFILVPQARLASDDVVLPAEG